jgi:division protein CdvB (Snf7/Vps24/ESCRT-III family)
MPIKTNDTACMVTSELQQFDTLKMVNIVRDEKNGTSPLNTINDSLKPSDSLKSRLQNSIRRIELENQRLSQASQRFQNRDKMIFDKVVEAYSKHDVASASVYANELVEIRKMEKMILQASLALEQISLRMMTVTDLGDIAVTLIPITQVIKEIKPGIDSISPQAEREFNNVGDVLNGLVVDSGIVADMNMNFEAANGDSTKILEEAKNITESRISETFPVLIETKASQVDYNEKTNNPL